MADAEPIAETDIDDADADDVADDTDRLNEVHERAMRRFDSVAVPQAEMRGWSLEDRRFLAIQGAMWEGPFGIQYENAPRPEVDQITKSLDKIRLDYRENRLMADYIPVGDTSDEQTADTLDGMFRADAYHYKAQQAWDNAFEEALTGGFGAWRLTTDYADAYDPENDEQRVNPGLTIVDADQSVYFDPSSNLYDKRDAKWCFVRIAEQRAEADAKWGEGIAPWPLDRASWNWAFDWYQPDTVSIAEYYEVEEASDRLHVFTNKFTQEERRYHASEIEPADARDMEASGWEKRSRSVKRRRVHKYIMSGSQVLKDCGYIAGSCIPIVPIYGKRVFVDNMERWEGYVRKRKDPQRAFNAAIARVIETDSRAPYEVPIFAPEQMAAQGIKDLWASANIDRTAYLLAQPLLDPVTGSIVEAGPVGKVEPPQVAPTTAAMLTLSQQILTGDDDNTDQVQANVSADAMELAKQTVDAKSGIFIDNAKQSHERGAEIYLEMNKEVAYEPGRKVPTLTADGQDGQATLHDRVVDEHGVDRVINDFSNGRYKVMASVQEATASRRAKTVKESLNIAAVATQAQAMPLAQNALLTAVANQDGEGMTDLQTWAHKQLVSAGVVKPTPEEAQEIAQAQAAQSQNHQPDPQAQALIAAANNQQSQAQLNQAKATQTMADAHLKMAQADAIDGPEQAPKPPTGLSPANDVAQTADTIASARLKDAQATKIDHDIHDKRIRTGHEIEMERRQQVLAERAQDHAESQSQTAA